MIGVGVGDVGLLKEGIALRPIQSPEVRRRKLLPSSFIRTAFVWDASNL